MMNARFELFLPSPSLSITSAAQRIRLLSAGTARSRKVTVGMAVVGCGREWTVAT